MFFEVRNIAVRSRVVLGNSLVSLVLMSAVGAGQVAHAQQGSDCLTCHTGLPATLANLIPEETTQEETVVSNACDYTSADLFDGWGWNPITQTSCAPLSEEQLQVATNCDYTSAANFGGWGWDPIARESCPPAEDEDPHAAFPICSATFYDVDGDGFGWENEASCIVTLDSEPAPVFTNRETGNLVNLIRANWDGNNDIAGKIVLCGLYYYDSYNNQYLIEPGPYGADANQNYLAAPSYQFYHQRLQTVAPFLGELSVSLVYNGPGRDPASLNSDPYWTTNDGRYIGPTVLQSPYVELVTRPRGAAAVRIWHNSGFDTALDLESSGNRVRNDGYFECWDATGLDFEPTRGATGNSSNTSSSNANSASQCDYSNADSFGGWGWNPVTRESCAPQSEAPATQNTGGNQACDYSNANLNGGWGWNSATSQSCAPR